MNGSKALMKLFYISCSGAVEALSVLCTAWYLLTHPAIAETMF